MPSKEEIKAKLCINSTSLDYPLENFLEWVEQQHYREVLRHLEQIQQELYADERTWREASAHGNVSKAQAQASRWCFYCAQLRAYYEGVLGE